MVKKQGKSGAPSTRKPKVVSDVRSPHGTRVMKRIVCSRCGKSDTLPFVPKAGEAPLCSACAELAFNVTTETAQASADRMVACKSCGNLFPTPKRPREPHTPKGLEDVADLLSPKEAMELCLDCRTKLAARRRNVAKKPTGVHPIVVKGRRGKE